MTRNKIAVSVCETRISLQINGDMPLTVMVHVGLSIKQQPSSAYMNEARSAVEQH